MSQREMFARVPRHAWRKAAGARLSGRAWSLLVVLYGYADAATGRAYPGLTTLSEETGIEPRDIPRVTRELVTAGLVLKVDRGARSHGRACNLYVMTTVQITDGESTDGESADGESAPSTTVQTDGESYHLSDQPSDAIASSGGTRAKQQFVPLPEDWTPDEKRRQVARDCNLDPDEVIADFREYFINNSRGQKQRRRDWNLSFAKWCRTERSRKRKNVVPFPQRGQGLREAGDEAREMLRRGAPQ